MQIEKYDVTIDNDGDGAELNGTIELNGDTHKLSINGTGRYLSIELDGNDIDEGALREELSEWTAPLEAVQDKLKEKLGEGYIDIEDWTARVVDGKVVRLLVLEGRGISVLVGTLTDDV